MRAKQLPSQVYIFQPWATLVSYCSFLFTEPLPESFGCTCPMDSFLAGNLLVSGSELSLPSSAAEDVVALL